MTSEITTPRAALKDDVEVREDGRVEFTVPSSAGTRTVVFGIAEPPDRFGDLVGASQSSLDFWNNA
ncbi:MAG: hypothetical protein M3Q65_02090 [Chloroflexota bacterium]|nr:hypothetical protein [Chloroflexota bacterium]